MTDKIQNDVGKTYTYIYIFFFSSLSIHGKYALNFSNFYSSLFMRNHFIIIIFFPALQNPNACLTNVDPDADPSKKYHLVLAASKENKIKTANNKPLDYENRNPNINDSSTNDAYDELLTQEEIQDHIDKINQLLALERIENYVKSHDVEVKLVPMELKHSTHFVHGFSQHIKIKKRTYFI